MKKLIWIDLESTGLFPETDTITELALLYEEYDEINNAVKNKKVFHEYCLPNERPSSYDEVEKITGLTWDFLKENGISEEELFNKLILFLDERINRYNKEDKAYFIGYNSLFDNQFIRELFKRHSNDKIHFGNFFYHLFLDTLQLSLFCEMFGLYDRPDNFKLETLAKHLKVVDEDKNNFHSALIDIKTTRKLNIYLQSLLTEKSKSESKTN